MLTPLDESLLHQAPTTFDHAVTSDHRFFDRWAVGVQDSTASIIYGLANYKNTDVCDGFLCVQHGDRQYNLRLSRPLRPDFSMRIGPLGIDVVEPLWTHRLVVERTEASPLSGELLWTGDLPAREEHPHHQRTRGRAVQDYCRLDQLGAASGWVAIGDLRVDLRDAFAWRDHSWGVRPGMGGSDPVTEHPAGAAPAAARGSLFVWLAFRAGRVAGQFQLREAGTGEREVIDGHLIPDVDDPQTSLSIADIRHDISFVDGHTAFDRANLLVTTGDGRQWTFEHVPLRAPWVFSGGGYSGGWDDGQGLGVPRGMALEADEYHLPGPADVLMPDGSVAQPWHRETDVITTVNGVAGNGHLTIIARPPLPPATLSRTG